MVKVHIMQVMSEQRKQGRLVGVPSQVQNPTPQHTLYTSIIVCLFMPMDLKSLANTVISSIKE